MTDAERAVMPDADTVWLTPLAELVELLGGSGAPAVRKQEERSRSHLVTVDALIDAFAADYARHRSEDRPGGARRPHGRPPAVEHVARARAGCASSPSSPRWLRDDGLRKPAPGPPGRPASAPPLRRCPDGWRRSLR